jgi:peptidoglycan/LPS O-acetylase OafA/YrhL
MKKYIYFENLDGLRAIAAMAVVLTHIVLWIPSEGSFNRTVKTLLSFSYNGGKYGVIFFFYFEWVPNFIFTIS